MTLKVSQKIVMPSINTVRKEVEDIDQSLEIIVEERTTKDMPIQVHSVSSVP